MNRNINKRLLSYLGIICSLKEDGSATSEYRYVLKYRFGIDVNSMAFENYNEEGPHDNEPIVPGIDTKKLYAAGKGYRFLSLMITAINKCDSLFGMEDTFFDLTLNERNEIFASKCLFLLVKVFLQAFYDGEFDEKMDSTKMVKQIIHTQSKDSSKWFSRVSDTNKPINSANFALRYKQFRQSVFFNYFKPDNSSLAQYSPIFPRFQRSVFFNPKTLIPRVKQPYCSIVYPHLDGLIDEKEHSGLMYDSIRTKYCKPWYKACIKQSEMAYTEYMEWFLKKYHEVNMKAYKKEYRILYHEWIEDYISERFLHFNFVNTLAKNFSFLKHIKDTENFMPIVMTENPFIATTYVNLLKKSYEEGRPLSYGKTRTKSHNLTSYVHNFGQFVDYMNYVYYPALYFTFLELLSHNKIERRKIISILQIMELIDKSNLHKKMELWPQIDEDTFSKVVGLLGCMIDIKNSNSYRLLKENNCYARSSRNTPSSETISEIVYYLQRIFDYPCLLEKYFYCDNALKIYPPISKQELKNSIHPYIIASVDELLANELNSIAQERNITDLNSLLQASFIESKPKSNPSHHPTPKSNDEAPQ